VTGGLYLAWRYLVHHRVKSGILVASVTLIGFLPGGLRALVSASAAQLTARAEATPLLVGARGSRLELVLGALYFDSDPPEPSRYAETRRIADSGLAEAIPLHIRFRVRDHPIVGTTLAYFELRGLRLAAGRQIAVLGEAVLGSEAARNLAVDVGDSVISSPEGVFDLAGIYPLQMPVVGVLAPSHGPDDRAVFVDLKTTWVIEGLGHGHQDLGSAAAAGAVLSRDDQKITANASVAHYNVIDRDNIHAFHFHGENTEFPVSATIAVPADEKSRVLLMGRYQGEGDASQIVDPRRVMDELLETVVRLERYAVAASGLVGVATLATTALVFALSLRLRQRELETLRRIGASRATLAVVIVSEMAFVLGVGALLAGALIALTTRFGSLAIRALLLS
jgi:putative ABC transport system permease protein